MKKSRLSTAWLFLIVALPGLWAGPLAAEITAVEAAKEELAGPAYQRELPGTGPTTLLPRASEGNDDYDGEPNPLIRLLIYLAGALLIGLLIVAIGRGIADWRQDRRDAATRDPATAQRDEETRDRQDADLALTDADRLAAAGDFAGAIHALLLAAIAILKRRLQANLARSATSREILRHTPLATPNRRAFADLIGIVELCHFGGRAADDALYRACRSHFHDALGASAS